MLPEINPPAQVIPVPLEADVITVHTKAEGSSGTQIYSGYINEDYLSTLLGRQRADMVDKMSRTDAQLLMCTSAVKNVIQAAVWEVERAEDTPEAQLHKDLIDHILDDMYKSKSKFIEEALTFVEHGHSVFEMVDKIVLGDPRFGNYVGIKNLGYRSQRTIERWNVDHETEDLLSVTQYAYGDLSRTVDMDAKFLLLFNMRAIGSNFEGIGFFRNVYGNFMRKDLYLKLNGIGIEKFAIPTPIAKCPVGKQNSEAKTALEQALEIYTTHQANYLIIPKDYELDLRTNTYDPEKVEASIDSEDERMVRAFCANFLNLGQGGSGGAYALSNDLSDFFLAGIKSIAHIIRDGINNKLIPRYIKLNFGPQKKYPKMAVSGIDDKAGKEFADMLKLFVDGKIIVPDDPLETNIRKRTGLPAKSLEGQRKVEPPATPGFGAGNTQPPVGLAERIRLADRRRING